MAGLVTRKQLGRLVRSQCPYHPCPPKFGLEHAHKYMPDFIDNQTVPRLPRLRFQASNPVLNGQTAGGLEKGIDTGGIGIEHHPGLRANSLIVSLGGRFQPEPPHEFVLRQTGNAHNFSPTSGTAAPVVLHVPQSVLSGGESLGKEGIPLATGPDMGNSEAVPVNLHRRI